MMVGRLTPEQKQMERTYRAYRAIGAVLNFSCTPYLLDNIPRQGEVVALFRVQRHPLCERRLRGPEQPGVGPERAVRRGGRPGTGVRATSG